MDDKEKEKTKEVAASTVAAASAVVAKSITPAGKLAPNTELADQMAMQIQTQQNNNIKKLVESMKTLGDRLKTKPGPKIDGAGEKNNVTGIFGALSKTLKELRQDKLGSLKQLGTKEGLLRAGSGLTGGGLTGMILGGVAEKLKAAREAKSEQELIQKKEQKTKEDWIVTYLELTRGGKKLTKEMGTEGAKKEAEKLYSEKITLEKEIKELKEKQKEKKATRIIGAGLSKEEQKKLEKGEKRLSVLAGAPARMPTKKEETEVPTAKTGEKNITKKPGVMAPEKVTAIDVAGNESTGAFEHLVDINQEQLDTLKKIVSAVTVSEEQRLEDKKQTGALFPTLGKTGEKPDESKGLFQTVVEGLSGVFSGGVGKLIAAVAPVTAAVAGLSKFLGPLTGMFGGGGSSGVPTPPDITKKPPMNIPEVPVPNTQTPDAKKPGVPDSGKKPGKLARAGNWIKGAAGRIPVGAVGSSLAVAGAGYAGYEAGGLLNEYVLNPASEAITGTEGETVGTALYSSVDKIQGMLGFKTDAEKEKEAEKASYINIYNKKLAEGAVSPQLAKKMEEFGIKTPETAIKKPTPKVEQTSQPTTATKIQLPEEDLKQTKAVDEKVIKELQQAISIEEKQQILDVIGKAPMSTAAIPSISTGGLIGKAPMSTAVMANELIGKAPMSTAVIANELIGKAPMSTAAIPSIMALPAQKNNISPIVSQLSSQVTPVIPRAEEQTNIMRDRTTDVENAKTQKPIIINTPVPAAAPTIIGNSTNTTIVRPDTRTQEPTFNRVLSRNFTFA